MASCQGLLRCALLLFLLLPSISRSAVFTVTNVDDSGPGSLRQAIQLANQTLGADTIEVQDGLAGSLILQSNLPPILDSLTITGSGRDSLTIDGSFLYRGLRTEENPPPGLELTVSDLTFTAMRHERAEQGGNAISFIGHALDLQRLNLVDNGIELNDKSVVYVRASQVDIFDLIAHGNQGLSSVLQIRESGDVNLETLLMWNNTAYFYSALAVYNAEQLKLRDCDVRDNQGLDRGTVALSAEVSILVSDCEIHDNSVVADFVGYAAGLWINAPAAVVERTSITGNGIAGPGNIYGSGITVVGSDVIIRNTTVSGNSGAFGGIYVDNNGPSQLTRLEYVTVVGNSSDTYGGGVYLQGANSMLLIASSIIFGNLYDNTESDLEASGGLSTAIVDHSLIGSIGKVVNYEPVPGTNLIGVDPLLGPLSPASGDTLVHIPNPTSPVIDAIAAAAPACSQFPEDQRGLSRPALDGCDFGAIEIQSSLFSDGLENTAP